MDATTLAGILERHAKWLRGEEGGERADLQSADLRSANLRYADLRYANLRYANLQYADLQSADLQYADLQYANLQYADLRYANLQSADLRYADLRYANLRYANLQYADLQYANLQSADLRSANLQSANLQYADLREGVGLELAIAQTRVAPPDGPIVGWKKCRGEVLVKVLIPEDAKRSNAFGRKCRAEFVQVLEIVGAEQAVSSHDRSVIYRVGETVRCHEWDDDFANECSGGIHFFITRMEAQAYA